MTIITIDGPTASGKGVVAKQVAAKLNFFYLDSGALYRLIALAACSAKIACDDEVGLAKLALTVDFSFLKNNEIWLNDREVSKEIRTEFIGNLASIIATHAKLRVALLERQRIFAKAPGLVADGRDMGTNVFPGASLKFFLLASVEIRAARRYKQLLAGGLSARMEDVLFALKKRDARDYERSNAPLEPAKDAYQLDSSNLSINQVVTQILALYSRYEELSKIDVSGF